MTCAGFLDAVDQHGCGLRIEFVRQHDRFAHNIGLVDRQHVAKLLTSVEGTDQDEWPISPPLQELSIEDRTAGHRVALLVGMAGTSHWSLSVDADGSRRELIFDVACRIQRPARWLGTTYNAMTSLAAVEQNRTIRLTEHCQLHVENLHQESIHSMETNSSRLVISVSPTCVMMPATVRWKYRISRA